jgi:hypothetical protein
MRTSGVIYKKLRDIKFHHLIDLYRKYLKKIPQNCKYNYIYLLQGDESKSHQIGLCLCHQEHLIQKGSPQEFVTRLPNIHSAPRLAGITPHLLDICQAVEDCQNCNAFVHKHTRQTIKELFEKELSIKKIREEKYPDICALEWVLERSSVGISSKNFFLILINKLVMMCNKIVIKKPLESSSHFT